MKKTIIVIVAVVVLGGAGWYLLSPLVFDKVVEEAFPVASVVEKIEEADYEEIKKMADDVGVKLPTKEKLEEMGEEAKLMIEKEIVTITDAMPDTVIEEEMSDEPVKISSGSFVDADSFHKGSGQASIYKLADGSHVLRFENFDVTNGPDLRVLLTKNASDLDAGYVEIAKLKGNQGNQNYELSSSIDPSDYAGVMIYCKPFHVSFSTAELQSNE